MYLVLCLPLALFPSILPVITKCSLVCGRSAWPKKLVLSFPDGFEKGFSCLCSSEYF